MLTFSNAIERLAASQRGLAERLPPPRSPPLVKLSPAPEIIAAGVQILRSALEELAAPA